jgi:hypothetical protein
MHTAQLRWGWRKKERRSIKGKEKEVKMKVKKAQKGKDEYIGEREGIAKGE